jgi:hypothetical protein
MSKVSISFRINLNSGEADIDPASLEQLKKWISHEPLFAADILKDIKGISANLYSEALHQLFAEWVKDRPAGQETGDDDA